MAGDMMSPGPCCAEVTVQHRAGAGVSSEGLSAEQTGQKPLQAPNTQKG